MKRFLPVLALFCLTVQMFGQKLALIEEFTQASCPPCATYNPVLDAVIHDNEDKVVVLKYQVWWPGFDPMYNDNTDDVATRVQYYGVTSAPTALIEGPAEIDLQAILDGNTSLLQNAIDNAVAQNPELDVYVNHVLDSDLKTVDITVTLKNNTMENFVAGQNILHVSLIEKDLQWPFSPGSNGEEEFTYVMKKMYPDGNGTSLAVDIAAGDSLVVSFGETLPSYVYDFRELAVVAFVQDNSDQSIASAGISNPIDLGAGFPDAALINGTEAPDALCDAVVKPAAQVTNNGMTDITEFDLEYTVNGSVAEMMNWTGTLAPGANVVVEFDDVVLPGGTTAVGVSVANINQSIDLYTLDNRPADLGFTSLSNTSVSTTIDEANEDYTAGNYPEGSVVQAPIPLGQFGGNSFLVVDQDWLGADNAVGGYGESDKAFWVNFYQWNPAEAIAEDEGSIIYQKIDLTGYATATLSFDRAGARYQGSNDRLQVLVSTDCAETWTIVHDVQGADLSTVDGHTEPLYIPTPDQWETDQIDLTDYVGIDGVNIQFKAISAWGNSLFIDNIGLQGFSVGTKDVDLFSNAFKVFPNPATDFAQISLETSEIMEIEISFTDISGKVIDIIQTKERFDGGSYTFEVDVNGLAEGLYFVNIQSDKGQSTRKLVVK